MMEKNPLHFSNSTTPACLSRPPVANIGPIPIVVGVTGHRDIPDEDVVALEAAVIKELKKFCHRFPASPLFLLTGLAEGADCLVAHCALRLGWKVGAVLAFPQAKFEETFTSGSSVPAFRDLLKQCAWVRVVAPDGATDETCYAEVGHWIARQAQWLIALWDGQDSEKRGGTAYVKKVFLEGRPCEKPELPDSGPVVHIWTRRSACLSTFDRSKVGELVHLWPNPAGIGGGDGKLQGVEEKKRWQKVLTRIDEFNRLSVSAQRQYPDKLEEVQFGLRGRDAFPEMRLPRSAEDSGRLYALADRLALNAQQGRNSWFKFMVAMALFGVFFEALYSGPVDQVGLLIVALAFVLIATLPNVLQSVFYHIDTENTFANDKIYYPIRSVGDWVRKVLAPEAHYLDFRALAEACRVQYFWKVAGISDNVADHFLVDQRDELEWIRQAVRSIEIRADEEPRGIDREDVGLTLGVWIKGQRDWYGLTQIRERRNAWKGSLLAGLFLVICLSVVLLTIVLQSTGTSGTPIQSLQVVYGMALALAAATNVYQRTQGYAEKARSYRRMGLTMSLSEKLVQKHLNDPLNIVGAQRTIRDTGIAALAETSDWLLLHRARPIGPPIA